jgi:hypothetical protein
MELLFINAYTPYDTDEAYNYEFIYVLLHIQDMINANSDCQIIFCDDLNFDFARAWTYTVPLNSFCDNMGLLPITWHVNCNDHNTYNFAMNRFSLSDNFLLSGSLFSNCINSIFVLYDADSLSDPIQF